MKAYYLTLSQTFPKYMHNAGEPTNFEEAFKAGQVFNRGSECLYRHPKFHTIRANYESWRKRFEKIAAGEACLSIRQWVGKPYGKGSTQREIARLTREDGIGIQMLTFAGNTGWHPAYVEGRPYTVDAYQLAHNDGLEHADWSNWFAGYDLTKPLAIIHFTRFRY